MELFCVNCGDEIIKNKHSKRKFCSRSCSATYSVKAYSRKPFKKTCRKCAEKFESTSRNMQRCEKCRAYVPIPWEYKYPSHEEFFRNWSSDMAYVFGFIIADGCVIKNGPHSYSLRLYSTDKDVLDKIAPLLGTTPVTLYQNRVGFKKGWAILNQNYRLITGLVDLGVCPRKSLSMPAIHVPDEFFFAFLRGFTDGDGSIAKLPNAPTIQWWGGSFEFMDWLRKRVNKITGRNVMLHKAKDRNLYNFKCNNSYAIALLKKMYAKTDLAMDRKKKRAIAQIARFDKKTTGKRKVKWPTRRTLASELKSNSLNALGRKYGVTATTVKYWAVKYELV